MSNSNNNSNMNYHPLKNIPKIDQEEYYPNILKIGKDQKELENLISQYKNTYQEFVNTAKNINNNSQWVIERNVLSGESSINDTYLPQLFSTDITQEECILNCLNDPMCDYILFSDSGNGGCAANMCLKFGKSQNAATIETPQQLQDIVNAQNFVGSSGYYMETGCGYDNRGPTAVDYKFNGWTKPTWTDVPNATFTTKHALGGAPTLNECKKMALNKGPYSFVEFTGASDEPVIGGQSTNCYYATAIDNNLRINNLDAEMNSHMVSIASQNNSEDMKALQGLVETLNNLNGAIHNKLYELEQQDKMISRKNLDYESRLNFNSIDYSTAYQKLSNDRKILHKLYNENNTQDKVNQDIRQNLKMKKSRYWFLEFLI